MIITGMNMSTRYTVMEKKIHPENISRVFKSLSQEKISI